MVLQHGGDITKRLFGNQSLQQKKKKRDPEEKRREGGLELPGAGWLGVRYLSRRGRASLTTTGRGNSDCRPPDGLPDSDHVDSSLAVNYLKLSIFPAGRNGGQGEK